VVGQGPWTDRQGIVRIEIIRVFEAVRDGSVSIDPVAVAPEFELNRRPDVSTSDAKVLISFVR